MNRLSWTLLTISITSLLFVQGYFLYKQAVFPDVGAQVTIHVNANGRCKLPTYQKIKEAIARTQTPNSTTLLTDQIHVSLINSVLTAVLPANDIAKNKLNVLERSLNEMTHCEPKMGNLTRPTKVFHIYNVKTFIVHNIRPLDVATFVILFLSNILLMRVWLKIKRKSLTQKI